ncbi:hypothetical protein BRD00_04585 [Halobacteriales archaeon QS_8_69_26]|nr:MAG: hypothetical protein BRD00_04585 [Halobacteriales archaeon QS_8_69_26]
MTSRRRLLQSGAALGAAGLAGCFGLLETRSANRPPLVEDRPDAVYVPSHVDGMVTKGTTTAGDVAFAVTYSTPHRFWTVTGTEATETPAEDDDEMHLMAVVWDPETETVLPETGLSIELTQDGDLVAEEVVYPMLSQRMGFHYGDNFGVPGDGTYTANLDVSALPIRRTGAFQGRFDGAESAAIEFEFSEAERSDIEYRKIPEDRRGDRGAVDPMQMEMLPDSTAPRPQDLPGNVVGEAESGDAVFVATLLESPPAGLDGSGRYLAVSARTPHTRSILPMMGLSATVSGGGTTRFDGMLNRTLDPDLDYHYGAVVGEATAGDEIRIEVTTPPQVARHEGYETAFLDMDPMTLTV